MGENTKTDGGKYKCLRGSSGMSGVALTPSADGRMLDGRHSLNILLLCFDQDDHAHDGVDDHDDLAHDGDGIDDEGGQ